MSYILIIHFHYNDKFYQSHLSDEMSVPNQRLNVYKGVVLIF